MHYVKTIFLCLKQRKGKAFIIFSLLLFIFCFKVITNKIYYYNRGYYDYQSGRLVAVINSVMGIPYAQSPEYRNDSPDIVRLSKEEWLALPYYKRIPAIETVKKSPFVDPMPSLEEAVHANALELRPIWRRFAAEKAIFNELCGYFLTCKSLNIAVQEYVFHRPELLQNIIKIAERPCDYIRNIDEAKPGDEIYFSTSFYDEFEAEKFSPKDILLNINIARKALNCDQKSRFNLPDNLYLRVPLLFYSSITSRKFVLLVVNKKGIVVDKDKDSFNIIIERKDIE